MTVDRCCSQNVTLLVASVKKACLPFLPNHAVIYTPNCSQLFIATVAVNRRYVVLFVILKKCVVVLEPALQLTCTGVFLNHADFSKIVFCKM